MKSLLWYLLAGTRGGPTRGRILQTLIERPMNAHELAKTLTLDYKTIRHHLKLLEKNNIIYALEKDAYGAVYFPTETMTAHLDIFDEIWTKRQPRNGSGGDHT